MPTTPEYPALVTPLTGEELVPVWQNGKQRSGTFAQISQPAIDAATAAQQHATDAANSSELASQTAATLIARLTPGAVVPTYIGAKGDGVSPLADQDGFDAAMKAITASRAVAYGTQNDLTAFQNGSDIEPGIYDVGNLTLAGSPTSVRLKARVPGTVIVRIPAGQWFLTTNATIEDTFIEGIIFLGGLGVVNYTGTGANVAGKQVFRNNVCYGYTVAGVTWQQSDMPYWAITDNVFYGTATSKGIAGGGDMAGSVILRNAFLLNAYHIALFSPNGFVTIFGNDFIQFMDGIRVADIWSTSQTGLFIEGNKFGPENTATAKQRILFANADTTTGTSRATYLHSTTDSSGTVANITIINNLMGEISGGAPFIKSYIQDVRRIFWENNQFSGNEYSYIAQFMNGYTPYYVNGNSCFIFQKTDPIDGNRPATRFSNATFATLYDHASYWPGDVNAVEVHPLCDNPSLALVGNGLVPSLRNSYNTVTRTLLANSDGEMVNENVITTGTYSGIIINVAAAAAGGLHFIEIPLAQSATRSLTQVHVDLYNGSAMAFSRDVILPATMASLKLPLFILPGTAPNSWQLRIYVTSASGFVSGTADSFVIGQVVVNSGMGRMGRKAAWDSISKDVFPTNRNLQAANGASFAYPFGWGNNTSPAGITVTPIRKGQTSDGFFLDIGLSGTATATGVLFIYPDAYLNPYSPTIATWLFEMKAMLTGGDLSWVNTVTDSAGNSGKILFENDFIGSNGVTSGGLTHLAFTPTTALQLFSLSRNYNNGGIFNLSSTLRLSITNGAVVTAGTVLRLFVPKLRRAA